MTQTDLPYWFTPAEKEQAIALIMLGYQWTGSLEENGDYYSDSKYYHYYDSDFPLIDCHNWQFQLIDGDPILFAYCNNAVFELDMENSPIFEDDIETPIDFAQFWVEVSKSAIDFIVNVQSTYLKQLQLF